MIYRTIPGFCRRGLHEMTEANTYVKPNGWKLCRACRTENFRRDRERHGDKRNANTRAWAATNKDRVAQHHRESRQKIQKALNEAKDGVPCRDCGQTFPNVCMDFDHVKGTKLCNVGQAKTFRQLYDEIAKCELVCANCHRIRTAARSASSTS